jgi:hypothetical protein
MLSPADKMILSVFLLHRQMIRERTIQWSEELSVADDIL